MIEDSYPIQNRTILSVNSFVVEKENQLIRVKFSDNLVGCYLLQREALWIERLSLFDLTAFQRCQLAIENQNSILETNFIPGVSLQEWNNKIELRREKIKCLSPLIEDLITKVNRLHQMHIIHGDIKLSNVLLVDDVNIELIDFASCRYLGDNWQEQGIEHFTPSYCPPNRNVTAHYSDDYYAICRLVLNIIAPQYQSASCSITELVDLLPHTRLVLWFDQSVVSLIEDYLFSMVKYEQLIK
ncbi:hypothetical protein L0B53_00110 [Vibrio sp. SS-MA-C1-2]|uniref:protein kinase domain-containing protein n=1 Tax=Vibrio sp. SS-MA-C1-2 TaxID=2908646 RepID=UPI001F393283|nr:hypothetical protein [Vibrio sp. SS-MA-C1-2]UJF17215.1 hypothetical protein L0B53_00110 [Vibrio sp. SS-MA-C1-2]